MESISSSVCAPPLKEHGFSSEENLLQHLSPLGWEHINLTGDYVWRQNKRVEHRQLRPLRPLAVALRTIISEMLSTIKCGVRRVDLFWNTAFRGFYSAFS